MSELDLDKGFNESELEDIMSEIESLEKDFGDDIGDTVLKVVEEAIAEEVVAEVIIEEVIEESAAEEELEAIVDSEFTTPEEMSSPEELTIAPEEVDPSSIQSAVEADVALALIDKGSEVDEKVIEIKHEATNISENSHETKMDFSVAGQMNLKLNFWVNGQSIQLHVSEEEGFVIEMDGGAKFSLPVGTKKAA